MQPFSQFDARGGLRHLLTLAGLDDDLLRDLLDRAQHYVGRPGEPRLHGRELQGVTVANLFSEPSTRTRSSFELWSSRRSSGSLCSSLFLGWCCSPPPC